MKIETYVLAVENGSEGEMILAPRARRVSDLPVCFSSDYADHLFDFSESRVSCNEGDQLYLLKGDVDISGISQQSDFPDAFKALIQEEDSLDSWAIIRQKSAMSTQSIEYKRKVHDDLVHTHTVLQVNKMLLS